MTDLREAVLEAERAFAAGACPRVPAALSGAIASRYLAVAGPRSFAIVGAGDDAAASLVAHRTWFAPPDVRCTDARVAALTGGRVVSLAEALAADIACVHEPIALAASQLRRGSHINALAGATLDADLAAIACVTTDLAPLAAGLIEGRRLDEITIYITTSL
jgi:ornithine cyclodeaminase/alanine dehydrogenase-like protein (mu-crystallin family)